MNEKVNENEDGNDNEERLSITMWMSIMSIMMSRISNSMRIKMGGKNEKCNQDEEEHDNQARNEMEYENQEKAENNYEEDLPEAACWTDSSYVEMIYWILTTASRLSSEQEHAANRRH